MIADMVGRYGIEHFGIGSDLCQDQPDSVVTWMRNGRWSKTTDYGEGSKSAAGFPDQPDWFANNTHFSNIANGLQGIGFSSEEIAAIMGGNWLRFYDHSFESETK